MVGLLRGLLGHLPQRPPQPLTIFAFEAKLLRELGLSPETQAGQLSPGAKHILASLLELDELDLGLRLVVGGA